MTLHKNFLHLLIAYVLLSLLACERNPIELDNAYIPVRNNLQQHYAAYFTLHNNTATDLVLLNVKSPQFSQAMLHESTFENNMSRMRHMHEVHIPANSKVVFAPNGKHVMLMQATEQISIRESIELVFKFKQQDEQRFIIPLRTQ
ncbi:MAG: copper chaperone PCu(A)C [Gammaproteobacteria bacterium]|nr:copper chaperone PCu(A)C [Gammaproteobacteria bacterium]NNC96941.1 copper chaperone PCu(A)C [Gammaproteobacteria bacterium]NNM13356.1 copper chaperone PCu(A)C [Gammaproteobacteria bacterium]